MLPNITKKLGLLEADGLEKKLDQVEEKEKKNADRLVKAIVDLTAHLKTVEKSSRDQKGKDRPTVGGLISDTKDKIKSFQTMGGILGHAADAVAHKPIMGAILGTIANKVQNKEAEKEKEKSFVAAVATGSTYGRDLMAQAGNDKDAKREVAKKIAAQYKEKQHTENELEAMNAKRSEMKSIGKEQGIELDLDETDLKKIEELETKLKVQQQLFKTGKTEAVGEATDVEKPATNTVSDPTDKEKSPDDKSDDSINGVSLEEWKAAIIEAIREGMSQEIDALTPAEGLRLDKAVKDDPEKFRGIMEGVEQGVNDMSKEDVEKLISTDADSSMTEEITSLNRSQLDELIKISAALEQKHEQDQSALSKKDEADKEAELEGKLKSGLGEAKDELPTAEKKKGLITTLLEGFGKVKDLFNGGFTKLFQKVANIFKPLMGMVSRLLPLLGPILGVVAAGAAGAAAGTALYENSETVRDGAINAVDSTVNGVRKFMGVETDEEKNKRLGAAEELRYVTAQVENARKTGAEMAPLTIERAKRLGIDVSGVKAMAKPGEKPAPAPAELTPEENAAETQRLAKKTPQDTTTEVAKKEQDTTALEKIATYTETTAKKIDDLTEKTASKPQSVVNAPTVVNAQKTINQNTTNVNRISVRNPEPTYTKNDSVRFSF